MSLRDHSLSIFFAALLLAMIYSDWIIADLGFVAWLAETIRSLEADVFGALLLIVVTKYLQERGSPQSR